MSVIGHVFRFPIFGSYCRETTHIIGLTRSGLEPHDLQHLSEANNSYITNLVRRRISDYNTDKQVSMNIGVKRIEETKHHSL